MTRSFSKLTLSSVSTHQVLNFSELELYDVEDNNIALLGTASATSMIYGSAGLGNDGNTDQVATGQGPDNPVLHTDSAAIWTLDLDRSYLMAELQKAVFYNRDGQHGENNRAIGTVVTLHSSDGLDTEVIGICNADLVQTFAITGFNKLTLSSVSTHQVLNFSELELYDMKDNNIALLGTASATSMIYGSAGLGNDGNTAHVLTGQGPDNPVLHTDGSAIWTLDLDKAYLKSELQKVVFYNRDGQHGESDRAIGAVITLYSSDGLDPVEVGVCGAGLVQTFTITEKELLFLTPGVATIDTKIEAVVGALSYRLAFSENGSGDASVVLDGVRDIGTDYCVVIKDLQPGTEYLVTLYVNSGNGYVQASSETTSTLSNSSENYDIGKFGDNGSFDLSSLDTTAFRHMKEVMNELFTTGEKLEISMSGRKTKLTFVKTGDVVSTDDSVLVPFDASSGAGQKVTFQLSDNSTTEVVYNDTSDSISIGGTEYHHGDSFVFDNKKCVVQSV
ncbi:unnamed protein product [Ectocarpus sp. 8 AP-2014]